MTTPIEIEGRTGYVARGEAPSHERADWCLRELYRTQLAELAYRALAEQSAAHWRDLIGRATCMQGALESELAELAAGLVAMLADATGKKSVDLPCGSVGFRASDKWEWGEAPDLLAWCSENLPDAITSKPPKPAVDKATIKRHAKDSGELPPMVSVEKSETFWFKLTPGAISGPPEPAPTTEEVPF